MRAQRLCTYMGRDGRVCSRRCCGTYCHKHNNRETHSLCKNQCGRATRSVTGYCSKCGPGQAGLQGRVHQEMLKADRRDARLRKMEEQHGQWGDLVESLYASLIQQL